LVRFPLGQGDDDWWVLGDTALWISLVAGGLGLLLGRAWSRFVLLIAAAASVVQGLVDMVFLSGASLSPDAVSLNAIELLPPAAIFVGALTLPAPAARPVQLSSGPVAKRAVSPRVNLAYVCFAWIALVLCASPLVSLLPLSADARGALGMLVGLPIALATLVAVLTAVVLSVIQWREWPLLTMSAITASMLPVLLAEDEGTVITQRVALAWHVGSAAVLIFLCARWFAVTRRRGTPTQEIDQRGP
jgi:hypothetical protein